MLKSRIPSIACPLNTRLQSTSPQPRPYKFHIGASFAGKPATLGNRSSPSFSGFQNDSPIGRWRDKTLAWPKAVQNPNPGEDFFFIQEMRNGSGVSLGVADGVGAWVESDVDPSLFAQAICYHAHRYSKNAWAGEPEMEPGDYNAEPVEGWELTPQECIELSHGGVLRERAVQAGSSTFCVLNLNARTGLLRAANLGDSGFLILRSYNIVYEQPAQTHFFNCPYQLAKLPSTFRRYAGAYVDSPKHAATYSAQLRGGDIIIAYTDGLVDNIFPGEITSIASLVMRQGTSEEKQVQDLADRLVDYASICMFKKDKVSPFEKSATREGMYFKGGKIDDVTTVVVIVEECQ